MFKNYWRLVRCRDVGPISLNVPDSYWDWTMFATRSARVLLSRTRQRAVSRNGGNRSSKYCDNILVEKHFQRTKIVKCKVRMLNPTCLVESSYRQHDLASRHNSGTNLIKFYGIHSQNAFLGRLASSTRIQHCGTQDMQRSWNLGIVRMMCCAIGVVQSVQCTGTRVSVLAMHRYMRWGDIATNTAVRIAFHCGSSRQGRAFPNFLSIRLESPCLVCLWRPATLTDVRNTNHTSSIDQS